jgi:hypothetical protein
VRLRVTWSELAARLAAEGQVPDPAAAAPPTAIGSAWYVRALAGGGAWVASIFFLAFVLATSREDESAWLLIGGCALAGGVFGLLVGSGDFFRQLSLAGSLAGQMLIAGSILGSSGPRLAAAVSLAIALVLLPIVPVAVHRFVCTWIALVALTALVVLLRVPLVIDGVTLMVAVLAGWMWLAAPARRRIGGVDRWMPVAHALVLGLLGGLLAAVVVGANVPSSTLATPGRVASAGLGLLTVALVLIVRRGLNVARPTPAEAAGLGALALIGFATPGTPGLPAAIGALVIAFHRRSPFLLGATVLFLITFLGFFYYDLRVTLLVKSIALMGTGLVVLLAGWWLLRPGRTR